SSSFHFTQPACSALSTLSLHDALPIFAVLMWLVLAAGTTVTGAGPHSGDLNTHRLAAPVEALAQVHGGLVLLYLLLLAVFGLQLDRKSTRLNSSHRTTSYAVFCLKKKK